MVSVQKVSCSVTLQRMNAAGTLINQEELKSALVELCRDEYGVMVVNVIDGRNDRTIPHAIDNPSQIRIFQRFISDGKLSIQLSHTNQMIMIKNAPVDQLKTLMKALVCKAKIKGKKEKAPSQSQRILSVKARSLVDISPLQMQEMKSGAYISPNSRVVKHPNKMALQTPSSRPDNSRTSLKRSIYTPEQSKENRNKISRVESCGALQPHKTPSTSNTGLARSFSDKSLLPVGRRPVTMKPPKTQISLYTLSDEQQRVLSAINSGVNVFLTGCAGTGKSFLLKKIIGMLSPDNTFVTASTGVAASQIGGITLHSFAGIGSGQGDLSRELQLAQRPAVAAQWRKCKHLIIDEISMVDANLFSKLDKIGKVIRQNDRPFGGIQVIVSGDFLQLPPVCGYDSAAKDKTNEDNVSTSLSKKFAFQSPAWDVLFGNTQQSIMFLRTVYRQNDLDFVRLLRLIRLGKCNSEVTQALKLSKNNEISSTSDNFTISATRLCTHNSDADFINNKKLDLLQGDAKIFNATDSDPNLSQRFTKSCHVPNILRLKIGAQVMLAKNLNVAEGLVNGARGVVVGFDRSLEDAPIVRLKTGKTITMQSERFIMRCGGQMFLRRQIPLRLAWAFSIHRSQGMSLDCVEISLARVFEAGQAYVALSRARSFDGLRVLDFSANSISADSEVLRFYKRLAKDLGIRLVD